MRDSKIVGQQDAFIILNRSPRLVPQSDNMLEIFIGTRRSDVEYPLFSLLRIQARLKRGEQTPQFEMSAYILRTDLTDPVFDGWGLNRGGTCVLSEMPEQDQSALAHLFARAPESVGFHSFVPVRRPADDVLSLVDKFAEHPQGLTPQAANIARNFVQVVAEDPQILLKGMGEQEEIFDHRNLSIGMQRPPGPGTPSQDVQLEQT